jgi:hypothetical protein
MAKMTKAEMEAFKKKNFNMKVKVTEAQLNKLRKEGTPTKAIAKYKNDPAMREALNRFYGKDRVTKAIGSGTGSNNPKKPNLPPGKGPGNTRPKPPAGKGPGYTRPKSPNGTNKGEGSSSSSVGKGVATAAGATAVGVGAAKLLTMQDKKKQGKYAAPGKTVKTPVTRSAPGKRVAPKTGNAAKLGKAAKVVGKAAKFAGLNTPAGRVIAGASIASSVIKPLNVKGNSKRIAPMGNPKKTTKK